MISINKNISDNPFIVLLKYHFSLNGIRNRSLIFYFNTVAYLECFFHTLACFWHFADLTLVWKHFSCQNFSGFHKTENGYIILSSWNRHKMWRKKYFPWQNMEEYWQYNVINDIEFMEWIILWDTDIKEENLWNNSPECDRIHFLLFKALRLWDTKS